MWNPEVPKTCPVCEGFGDKNDTWFICGFCPAKADLDDPTFQIYVPNKPVIDAAAALLGCNRDDYDDETAWHVHVMRSIAEARMNLTRALEEAADLTNRLARIKAMTG